MKDKSLRIKNNFKKAIRKKNIESFFNHGYNDMFGFHIHPYYKNLHQYSKNKIHCSCAMCSAKTRNKGKRRSLHGNYSKSINYKISDQKIQDAMNYDLENYDEKFK